MPKVLDGRMGTDRVRCGVGVHAMLVLTRKVNQEVVFDTKNGQISLRILKVEIDKGSYRLSLGIEAPKDVAVSRPKKRASQGESERRLT